jgi:hypothetical protein
MAFPKMASSSQLSHHNSSTCENDNQSSAPNRSARNAKIPQENKARCARFPSKKKNTMTCDLHGCSVPQALTIALSTITNRPAVCEKINFIVGQGVHSKDSIPLLKLTLLDELSKRGYRSRVMPQNPGVLEVFPYQIERASRGSHQSMIIQIGKSN